MHDTTTAIVRDLVDQADADAFRTLNEAWITAFFTLEDADRAVIDDPWASMITPGGAVLLAEVGGVVVGGVGLLPAHRAGDVELVKMAVDPTHQGHGIGRRLMSAAIERARALGFRRVTLESNARLASAVHLYEAYGFRHLRDDEREPSPFTRADVAMVLDLP